MLKVKNLSKTFGQLIAVDDISFNVKKGEIFGFLGPNGAGKTTTINMICGLLKPDNGTVVIDGADTVTGGPGLRKKIGVVPQEVALYEELNAIENLKFWGKLYGVKGAELKNQIDKLLSLCDLKERAKDQVKKYSGGMKRRLNLAVGLIHKPGLLLLDEPVTALNPERTNNILSLVKQLRDVGSTVMIIEHNMRAIFDICDRIAVMNYGMKIAEGSASEVRDDPVVISAYLGVKKGVA